MDDALLPFVARPDGVLVRGRRGGSGPPALLLHGSAGSWRNFRPWLSALLPRGELLLPDLPGFGESPAPRWQPRLRTWARLVDAQLRELWVTPRLLVGIGLGASVALALLQTLRREAWPTLLVLHSPLYCPAALRLPVRWAARVLTADPAFSVLHAALEQPAVRGWALHRLAEGPDLAPAEARLLRKDFARMSLPALRGLLRDAVRADFGPLLRDCPLRTLILTADGDPFLRVDVIERLGTLMPAATVVVQRGVGHGWTAQAVAEQRRLLGDFLDQAG